MFSTVLKEVTGYLDKRFILSIFFPCLIFWGLVVGLMVSIWGPSQALETWGKQPLEIRGLLIILSLVWVTFFAYLLANYLTSLTRLYEGYWEKLPWLKDIAGQRRSRYQQELDYLWQDLEVLRGQTQQLQQQLTSERDPDKQMEIEAEKMEVEKEVRRLYREIYFYFPLPTRRDEVMPTRLGNIFKSAELYPYLRYNIDAVLIWPRLYALLPQPFAETLANAKTTVDLMVVVSFLSLWLSAIGLISLFLTPPWVLFLGFFWGGLLVSWAAYMGAVEAALDYGQLIRAAFDLYKGNVIKALGLKTPATLKAERDLWDDIDKYLYRGFLQRPTAFEYAPANPPKEAKGE